jgi:hypothetical protein
MAIKITTDKSKKVDITAKRLDDFIVNLEIKNESGNLVEFTRDAYTHSNKNNLTRGQKKVSLGLEDVMLFTITTEDDTPVLAACSSDLDLAMCANFGEPNGNVLSQDPTKHFDGNNSNGGNYDYPTNQRDFDKLYDEFHVIKIKAIANSISKSSHKNTAEEQSNYGIKNLKFTKLFISSSDEVIAQTQATTTYSNAIIYNHSDYRDWLYNIFTNTDVVKNSFMNSELLNNPNFTGYTGNRYIFFGKVEGNNSFQIKFDHDKFNLPAGNYKYTFKSLSNMANLFVDTNDNVITANNYTIKHTKPYEESYIDQTTWIHGKLKINE